MAIVLGALPDINYVAAANLPYGLDELKSLARSGTARRSALQNDSSEVPAEAEIVIEGEISLDAMERGEPSAIIPVSHGRTGIAPGHRCKSHYPLARPDFYCDPSRAATQRVQRYLVLVAR